MSVKEFSIHPISAFLFSLIAWTGVFLFTGMLMGMAVGLAKAGASARGASGVVGARLRALVWRFRSPHHFCSESEMRTSEPKPHWINKLLVSFDSEVRKRGCGTMMRTSESGH